MPAEAVAAPPVPAVNPGAASSNVQPSQNIDSAFAEFDEMLGKPDVSTVESQIDESGNETPPAPPEVKTTKPAQPAKPAAKPEAAKPAADQPVDKMAPKQLREAYTVAKNRIAEMEKAITELKSKPADNGELKALQEKLAEREKRMEDIQKELEFTAFEKSERFKETYEKPYHRAWNLGRAWVASLTVKDPGTGDVRQGTPADFDAIMQLSGQDPDQAAELMDAMLGGKSASVAPYMAKVNEHLQNMQEALKEAREKGVTRDKENETRVSKQSQEIRESIESAWKRFQGEAIEKYPHWFKPTEGDEEGNKALEKGFEQAARAFSKLNAADPNLTPEERQQIVASHAALFNKAAAFPRLVVQLKQRDAKIAALEKELSGFRSSQPGGGAGAPRSGGSGDEGWESALEKLAR